MIRPLKRYGQNYLVDLNVIQKFVSAFNVNREDNILEIGAGKGAITEELLKYNDKLTIVEIDQRAIPQLAEKFKGLSIIQKDILQVDFTSNDINKNGALRVVGNIPFNLSAPIFFKLIESRKYIKDAFLIVQKEVAQRLVAIKGTKDYGILSVLHKTFGKVNIQFDISAKSFRPVPNVNTGVVHIKYNKEELGVEDNLYIKTVKAAFHNRRKTLKNSLSNGIFNNIDFSNVGLDLSKRAEEFCPNDFITLAKFIKTLNA